MIHEKGTSRQSRCLPYFAETDQAGLDVDVGKITDSPDHGGVFPWQRVKPPQRCFRDIISLSAERLYRDVFGLTWIHTTWTRDGCRFFIVSEVHVCEVRRTGSLFSLTSRAHAADFASSIRSLQVGTFPRDKPLCRVRTGQVWSRLENHRTDVVSVYI